MDNRKLRQHFMRLLAIGFVVASCGVACAPGPPEEPAATAPKTIVFVHGAWGGGWQFHKVQPLLEEAGKEDDDFDLFAERARARGWTVVEMEGSHNPQWYQPENFADLMLQVIRD